LAVFSGGCTLEGAERVAEADLDTLQSLVEKSLVRHTDERFWMLETIREFALERLEESDEAEVLRRRHAERLAALTPPLGIRVRASDMDALAELRREYDNAAVAFDWALDAGRFDLCEKLLDGLWAYWITQGLTGEGYRRARKALERAPAPSGDLLVVVGELARYSGHVEEGIALKETALERFEEEGGTHRAYAATMTDIAESLAMEGELDRAQELAERALALRRESGPDFLIAHATVPLVLVALQRGDHARAAALSEESIQRWREAKRWSDLALEYLNAGTAYRRAGDVARARARLAEGLALARDVQDRHSIVVGLEQVAALAVDNGDPRLALQLFGAARELRESSGFAFALDEHALSASADDVSEEDRAALLAEGSEWPADVAVERALESLAAEPS
jgi:tetratricopeptide (TPR) repeat protein